MAGTRGRSGGGGGGRKGGGTLKASKLAARGSVSQKNILTSRVCTVCKQHMRQCDIGVELVISDRRQPGEPRRQKVIRHTRNCNPA